MFMTPPEDQNTYTFSAKKKVGDHRVKAKRLKNTENNSGLSSEP